MLAGDVVACPPNFTPCGSPPFIPGSCCGGECNCTTPCPAPLQKTGCTWAYDPVSGLHACLCNCVDPETELWAAAVGCDPGFGVPAPASGDSDLILALVVGGGIAAAAVLLSSR